VPARKYAKTLNISIFVGNSPLLGVCGGHVQRGSPRHLGKITKIRRASAEEERRIVGTVMVESDERDAKLDKANLIVTDKTRILKELDDKRVEAAFENLKVGQQVQAEFVEGPTIMIYPLQVAAAEIVILNNAE
jgi:hypothetical protein